MLLMDITRSLFQLLHDQISHYVVSCIICVLYVAPAVYLHYALFNQLMSSDWVHLDQVLQLAHILSHRGDSIEYGFLSFCLSLFEFFLCKVLASLEVGIPPIDSQ